MPRGGEPHSASPDQRTKAVIGRRAGHGWAQSSCGHRWCGEAGHSCGSVSEADRAAVRSLGRPRLGPVVEELVVRLPSPNAITYSVFSSFKTLLTSTDPVDPEERGPMNSRETRQPDVPVEATHVA